MYIYSEDEFGYARFKPDEAYERFGIKLISWEVAEPIENSFR